MRVLDLFCGAGGASMGYHLAGFEVVGVDIQPQPNYPFEFMQKSYSEVTFEGFDLIHASPPCQAYMPQNLWRVTKHPRFIPEVRKLLRDSGLPYVIENVPMSPLYGIELCGTMFGLKVLRHRVFETNWQLKCKLKCNHWGTVANGDFAGIYSYGPHGKRYGGGRREKQPKSQPSWEEAIGINWMLKKELIEAIPPAYTEFIGRQFIESKS